MVRNAVVIATLAFAAAGCKSGLPHDHGVQWVCSLNAIDDGKLLVPGYRQAECANANVSANDIEDHCKDDCESAFRAWGVFWYDGVFPWIYRDIDGCVPVGPPQNTGNPCKPGSIIAYNGGPANYSLGVHGNSSTASLTVGDDTGSTNVSGNIDVTIGPKSCTGPNCNLLITTLHLVGQNFKLGGHDVSGVDVQNRGFITGTWHSDGTFELPAGAVTIGTNFAVDGDSGSETIANSLSALHGVLAKNGSIFTLDGDFQTSDGKVHLSIAASAVASPPVAAFAPNSGTFECDAPEGIAHIDFSSASSSDPDNDIARRDWTVDGSVAGSSVDISTALPLGNHVVQVGVIDTRGAWDSVGGTISVVDTAPPTITASVTPDCLWPPNHKLALYQLGDNLKVDATDVCTAAPKVRIVSVVSSQATLGGGSGDTAPDVIFGAGAFCVRSERAGASKAARVYSVTIEAVDEAGNRSTRVVTVTVLHDVGGSSAQCSDIAVGNIVDDDDPRCRAAVAPSTLAPVSPSTDASHAAANGTGGCSMSASGDSSGGTIVLVVVGMMLLLRRRFWALLPLIVGCSSSPSVSFGNGPVAGASQGAAFSVAGSRATWNTDRSALTVLLANYAAGCGSSAPTPAQGQTNIEAVILIPTADAKAGTYQLSGDVAAGSTEPGLGITNYSVDSTGAIKQSTTIVSKGAVRIDQMSSTQIAGAIGVNDASVSLSGTFSTVICTN